MSWIDVQVVTFTGEKQLRFPVDVFLFNAICSGSASAVKGITLDGSVVTNNQCFASTYNNLLVISGSTNPITGVQIPVAKNVTLSIQGGLATDVITICFRRLDAVTAAIAVAGALV